MEMVLDLAGGKLFQSTSFIIPSKPAYHTVTYIQRHIPEVVLIQLTVLMMSTWLLETCREWE